MNGRSVQAEFQKTQVSLFHLPLNPGRGKQGNIIYLLKFRIDAGLILTGTYGFIQQIRDLPELKKQLPAPVLQ